MKKHITFEEIDSYIKATDKAENLDQVFALLHQQVTNMGFEKMTYWVRWPSFETKKPIFMTTYPTKFIDHYLEIGYQNHDMVGRLSIEKNVPFSWSEIGTESPITKIQVQLFDDSKSVGLKAGGSIPLNGQVKATLSVANDIPEKEFNSLFLYHRHELHLLSTYAHEKILALGIYNPLKDVKLTSREAEILTWVSRGKTYSSIGEILSIQEDTVKKIMGNVFEKLDVSNNTHAVSKAIIHGFIIP